MKQGIASSTTKQITTQMDWMKSSLFLRGRGRGGGEGEEGEEQKNTSFSTV